MGLDMQLFRKVYVNSLVMPDQTELVVSGVDVDASKVRYITEEVVYWRKANHIHGWFVKNVQKGIDDCGEYAVTNDQLQSLVDECKAVLENPDLAEDKLPTTEGCFFGNYDIDYRYMEQLSRTVKAIEELLSKKDDYSDISYTSSW